MAAPSKAAWTIFMMMQFVPSTHALKLPDGAPEGPDDGYALQKEFAKLKAMVAAKEAERGEVPRAMPLAANASGSPVRLETQTPVVGCDEVVAASHYCSSPVHASGSPGLASVADCRNAVQQDCPACLYFSYRAANGACHYGSGSDPTCSTWLEENSVYWGNGSINIYAVSCQVPTPSPTPSPTSSPTPSPTPSPTAPPVTTAHAVGDPHLQNLYGQRFDLMRSGKHTLVAVPKGSAQRLLHVEAEAQRQGAHCADLYFTALNITGKWVHRKRGYRFSAEDAPLTKPKWMSLGKVRAKVVHGRTLQGFRYLNFYVKNLEHAGFVVGGLLGVDDHTQVATPSNECRRTLTL